MDFFGPKSNSECDSTSSKFLSEVSFALHSCWGDGSHVLKCDSLNHYGFVKRDRGSVEARDNNGKDLNLTINERSESRKLFDRILGKFWLVIISITFTAVTYTHWKTKQTITSVANNVQNSNIVTAHL